MKSTLQCCPSSGRAPTVPGDEALANEQLAGLAKALGHPARVGIVRLLLRRDQCMTGEIVDQLPLAQSTVSQHLKQLRQAGLIRGGADGPRVCYCVDEGSLELLRALVEGLR